MSSQFFGYCRFQIRRLFRTQARLSFALLAAGLSFFLALTTYVWQWQRMTETEQALDLVTQKSSSLTKIATPLSQSKAELPTLNSAQLVTAIYQVADETQLPVDEISYALDDNLNQPYLRYRLNLSVSASYPVIRRFVDRFRTELSHVSLDTISCSREDIGVAVLSCDLSLSAFYRKAGNG